MLNVVLIFAGVAIAALLAYAATRPDTFRVERTASIHAPPERIYPWLDDLHAAEEWSPYYRKDPGMKKVYGGAEHGVGATFDFEGNREVGSGRVTITGTTPNRAVRMRLQMFKPFAADNVVDYTLTPGTDGRTDVTWAMTGKQPFLARVMGLFFDMDKMIGTDFANGLAQLKDVVEGRSTRADTGRSNSPPLGAQHAT